MKIEIEGIPPSLNKYAGRENSWEYRKEKKIWKEITMLSFKKPNKPIEKAIVHIHYIFPTSHRHDPDNYAGKFLLDGLVAGGAIVDDDFKHIRLELSAEVQKGVKKTIIEIKEVQE